MKIKKYVILGVIVLFFSFFTLPVLAASSDFLPQATQFFNRYCSMRRIPDAIAVSCYLFEKVQEQQTDLDFLKQRADRHDYDIATQSAKIAELEERIQGLENPPTSTPTPTPTPTEEIMYVASDDTWKFSTVENENWVLGDFDDSGWLNTEAPSGGQCNPSAIGLLIDENGAQPMSEESVIWSTGYFRKTFNLPSSNYSGNLRVVLDDDGDLYINGSHAISDHDGHVEGVQEVDISPFLINGVNTVALKVIDSAGGCQHAQVEIELVALSLVSSTPLSFAIDRPASFETDFMPIPSGYRTMTFNVSTTSTLINWAPGLIMDGLGFEQHRFNCSGLLICPEVTIPIISNSYQFRTGTSSGNITALATLNTASTSQSILLGRNVNLPFISYPLNTDGFNSMIISVGQRNPQNLQGISIKRLEGGTYIEKHQVSCDGGAECPLNPLPLLGGVYKIEVEGSGSGAIVSVLLQP